MEHGSADEADDAPDDLSRVPLFPLPGVVLLPRAVLPLHIFEERYKAMTADALQGTRRIAMALLKPGWEKNYYGRPAIEPVVCVGEVLTHEQLHDGKYNFLLRGLARARIVLEHEVEAGGYRLADLKRIPEIPALESSLQPYRDHMARLLTNDLAALLPGAPQFVQMLASPLPTATVADLVAFHLLDDVAFKQELLADGDVARRAERVVAALARMRPPAKALRPQAPQDPTWN